MGKKAQLVFLTFFLVLAGCSHMETKEEEAKIEVPPEALKTIAPVEPINEFAKPQISPPEPGKTKVPSAPPPPYRLNIGDTLEISVLDEPEMTREVKIIPDGSLTYLLVGEIPAQGKTIKELRDALSKALEEYFVAPYVSVITKELQIPPVEEKRVAILGALKTPGNFKWHKGDKVLDIIAEAGGLLYTQTEFGSRTTANLKASYLSRNGKNIDVDFFRLLQLGDMEQNILLKPDDFVYIADAEDANIVVMGEVNEPKIIPYTRDISLIEALSMSGGFTREAYQSRVVILRTFEDDTKYVEVNVNDLLHGRDVRNIGLEGGDIIFVPEQGISEYARYAKFITDMFEVVIRGYELRETIRFPKLNRNTPSD